MSNFFKLFLLSCALILSGCRQDYSMDELMTHPDVLKNEIESCHQLENKTRATAAHCEVVMAAADQFIKLLDEQQHDPEMFGVKIMRAQSACVAAKIKYRQAKKAVRIASKSEKNTDLTTAKIALNAVKLDYQKVKQEVKTLLAVVGVNSPE